jgi:signal transduction histidine kinase
MKADLLSDQQRLETESDAIIGVTERLILMLAAGGFLVQCHRIAGQCRIPSLLHGPSHGSAAGIVVFQDGKGHITKGPEVIDQLLMALFDFHAKVFRLLAVAKAFFHLVGQRFSLEGENIVATVMRTGRAARMDNHDDAAGPAAARIRELGMRSAVGAPIIVAGRLWGAATVSTSRLEPLPADAEARVCDFADLVATAIANAHAHAELTASRVRIVAAADKARRRIERDLHDGAQQRLVSLGLELRTVETGVPADLLPLKERISDLVTTVNGISEDLQELSRGIHPAILSKGGLGPAIKVLARRSPIPVELLLGMHRRLPDPVEVAAYYVVAEALTNAAKHARASMVEVCADTEGQDLHLSIRDDGIGGADAAKGSGISGLRDRVEALGGTLSISSHPGIGTELRATIPFEAASPTHPDGS